MMFAIGVIAYIVGQFVFRFYGEPLEMGIGDAIGVALMLAGVAMALTSLLILAWRYLP